MEISKFENSRTFKIVHFRNSENFQNLWAMFFFPSREFEKNVNILVFFRKFSSFETQEDTHLFS